MRVAIPTFQGRVSPVLDVAEHLVVADVENGVATSRREETLREAGPALRAKRVSDLGVDALVCGAVSQPLEELLLSVGVQVIPQMCGAVDEVLQAFLSGRLADSEFLMPGCCRQRRRFRGGRPGG